MTSTQLILLGVVVAVVAVLLFLMVRRGGNGEPAGLQPALVDRLEKTRTVFGGRLHRLFGSARLDDRFWEELEEALIASDVGVLATSEIIARVRERRPDGPQEAKGALREELISEFGDRRRDLRMSGAPSVVIVVGVNGTGKTTSIAKLAAYLVAAGRSPLLGAADTFRAAAGAQLRTWAERIGVEIVSGQEGADPAAVAFDTYEAARARGHEVVIVDTAGRLHSKHNLMQELGKIVRVLGRAAGEVDEVLLVIDATNGQNAVVQARTFTAAVGVTGIILTKLDGTARGGVAVAVERELDLPVKFIGIGEGVHDLIPFVPAEFVDAMLEDV
ncbi:MAG: signal recognition particle-docking protein FtsY [Gammaproteobacteria bacterium]|nr:signal recognition particle-docking protein FtsY [Gammaproteobacteria bacterium]